MFISIAAAFSAALKREQALQIWAAWPFPENFSFALYSPGQMAKLLRYIVHTLEIFMWEQDYSLRPDEGDYDPFLDGEEDFFMEDLEDGLEVQPPKGSFQYTFHCCTSVFLF